MDGERPACPRCGGMTSLEEDEFGVFFSCMVCGWLEDICLPLRPRGRRPSRKDDFWERLRGVMGGEEDDFWERLRKVMGGGAGR